MHNEEGGSGYAKMCLDARWNLGWIFLMAILLIMTDENSVSGKP